MAELASIMHQKSNYCSLLRLISLVFIACPVLLLQTTQLQVQAIPPSQHICFNLNTDTYDHFYGQLEQMLRALGTATPFNPQQIQNSYILGPTRPIFRGEPLGWIKVDVVGTRPEDSATLAIANDDLYLLGFCTSAGQCYILDSGFAGLPNALTLPFPQNYGELITGGHKNLYTVQLGKQSAMYAAGILANYDPATTPLDEVKDAMVRFILMISEAARFKSVRGVFEGALWEQQTFLSKEQAESVIFWGRLSRLLINWARTNNWGGDVELNRIVKAVDNKLHITDAAGALAIIDFILRVN